MLKKDFGRFGSDELSRDRPHCKETREKACVEAEPALETGATRLAGKSSPVSSHILEDRWRVSRSLFQGAQTKEDQIGSDMRCVRFDGFV
jgi:hypothetical protein